MRGIHSDSPFQLKPLAAALLERVRPEVGTSQHDWYFNVDETRCVVHEPYQDP